jgi:hypothetical protein
MSNGRRLNTPVKKPYTPSATPTGKINVTDPGGDHDPLVVDDGLCVVALDVALGAPSVAGDRRSYPKVCPFSDARALPLVVIVVCRDDPLTSCPSAPRSYSPTLTHLPLTGPPNTLELSRCTRLLRPPEPPRPCAQAGPRRTGRRRAHPTQRTHAATLSSAIRAALLPGAPSGPPDHRRLQHHAWGPGGCVGDTVVLPRRSQYRRPILSNQADVHMSSPTLFGPTSAMQHAGISCGASMRQIRRSPVSA